MLTEKEKTLLQHLRKDSRKSLADISKETKIPISTLFDTLRKLESKVIIKHTALVDFAKLGHGMKAGFAISTKNKPRLKEYLLQHQNVNTLSSLANGYDFYAECIFKGMKEMIEFKEELEKFEITGIEETFIVDELKKEEFVV